MKTCHLAASSSLFYHISDLHTILPWLEYDPVMSQQCTPFKFEVEAASVDMLELYFNLGPSINSNAFHFISFHSFISNSSIYNVQ